MTSTSQLVFLALPTILGATLGTGCYDGPSPSAAVAWKVRCPSCSFDARVIDGANGSGGSRVDCTIDPAGNGQVSLYLLASQPGAYGIEVRGAVVSRSGGTIEPGTCDFHLQEDASYEAECGSQPPSADQPCQFTDLAIDGDKVAGKFLCNEIISPVLGAGSYRDVASATDSTQPASFTFDHCEVR
jgi:hypothetical protein